MCICGLSQAQTNSEILRKFDFVQGDKILVIENFNQDKLGDFPAKWSTNSGGEIVELNGENWFNLGKNGVFLPQFVTNLPENFTFEFDVTCSANFNFYSNPLHFSIAELAKPTLNPSAHYAIGLFKRGVSNYTNVKDAWRFMPPITPLPPQASQSVVVAPPSDNKLDIDIKTGGDNLEPRGFQTNPQITIHLRNRNPIILENINNNQSWPNNSIKRVSIPLPNDINLQDLLSINIKRTVVSNWNNFDAGIADNWNIDRVTATAIIKTNGRLVRTVILNKTGIRGPLVRIVYEKRNNDNPIEQREITIPFDESSSSAPPAPAPRTAVANPIIKIETLTGGDDLRGGNDNLHLLIKLKFTPARNISLNNINAGRKWPNFTERTITKPLMVPPFTFDDIEEIVLRHTGGGGIGADNWHLDKLKITLTIGGETRVLLDRVGAPIHFFTGEARSKTFQILR